MAHALDEFIRASAASDVERITAIIPLPIISARIIKTQDTMRANESAPEGTAPSHIAIPYEYALMSYYDHFRATGEAVKRLSAGFKQAHPEIDWAGFVEVRDAAAHWNEPEYEPLLKQYVREQKSRTPRLEAVRNDLYAMPLATLTEDDRNALKDLRLALTGWCMENAFHQCRQELFVKTLNAEDAALAECAFERYAQTMLLGALRSLQVKQGNLAAGISMFFRDAVGEASGFNRGYFSESRNQHAHFDIRDVSGEKVPLHYTEDDVKLPPTKYIDMGGFREWFETHGTVDTLAARYYAQLTEGLDADKVQILECTAAKLEGNRTPANIKQQQAYLLAISAVGRDISKETFRQLAETTLPLASAKRKNINLQAIVRQIPGTVAPLAERVIAGMKIHLMITESRAING